MMTRGLFQEVTILQLQMNQMTSNTTLMHNFHFAISIYSIPLYISR